MRQALLFLMLASSAAQTEDDASHRINPSRRDPQIIATINPEARISAVMSASLPEPAPCGSAVELNVKIVNLSFVTAPLWAAIVDDGSRNVVLNMEKKKLSGELRDDRVLHLTMLRPGPNDVTIVFGIKDNIGDPGGYDRVHFLLRCISEK